MTGIGQVLQIMTSLALPGLLALAVTACAEQSQWSEGGVPQVSAARVQSVSNALGDRLQQMIVQTRPGVGG
jgi:hypothetical protein